jgi:ABC-type phosphate/phosphonate transport system substrate-binding protein
MYLSSHPNKFICFNKKIIMIVSLMISSLFCSNSYAMEYNFVVQPIHSPEKMKAIYQPLVQYLNKETGHTFNIVTAKSFISYWEKMKKGHYDLILDAAHFTDYRVKRMNYSILAKIPNTVSFSIITNENEHLTNYKKLVGKKLITLPSPSLSAMHLAKMFPNPARQPDITNTNSAAAAIKAVQAGKYYAAIVPTSMLDSIKNINTVNTTVMTPHMAVSASPKIDKDVQSIIRTALIKASTTSNGKTMLNAIKVSAFKATNAKTYQGYEKLLASAWGYQSN